MKLTCRAADLRPASWDDPTCNPHELLGVDIDERSTCRIISMARWRLALLRSSTGTEIGVKRVLINQIIGARDAMLARVNCVQQKNLLTASRIPGDVAHRVVR